jgi:succinoglycan biosynthesis transport protein ExoP
MYLSPAHVDATPAPQNIWDLSHLLRVAKRRLRLMATILLVVIATTAVITFTTKPTYTASAQLLIEKPDESLISKSRPVNDSSVESATIETELEVLRSPEIALAVVRELSLDRDAEFNGALSPPGLKARILSNLPNAKPAAPASAETTTTQVIDSVLARLNLRRVGNSHVINLAYTSNDPDKAKRIANAFASNYMKAKLDAKVSSSQEGNAWLTSRIGEMRERVLAAETALQKYKISNNLMSAQGATLVEQEISTLDQQVAAARVQQAEANARLATASQQLYRGSDGDDVGESLNSPVIQGLRAQRALASQKAANLRARYGARHPDLLKANEELADIDGQIQAEIKRIMSNLQAQQAIANERAASIETSASRSRANLVQNNQAIVRYNELQRNADAERTLYESFLSKLKEMSAEAGLARSDAQVITYARAPVAPSAPRKGLNLAFGGMLGAAIAIATALAFEMLERGIADSKVVETELKAPYLGSVPSLKSIAARDPLRHLPVDYLASNPISSFAEAFRSLNAVLGVSGPVLHKCKVIAVTSSLPGEGKTTTAMGLAQTAGMSGLRAVVVDCDLRRRGGSEAMRIKAKRGLVELLKGKITLDEALYFDAPMGVWMIPVAASHFTPENLFNSDEMTRLVDQLRRRFDLVVLDCAPVILVTEARTVARHADMVVLLAQWRKTRRTLVKTAMRMLEGAGAHVVGVAMTQVDLRQQASVDPDDPSAYYLSFRNYYGPDNVPLPPPDGVRAPA